MNTNEIMSEFQIIGTTIKRLTLDNDYIFIDERNEDVKREIDVYYKINNIFPADIEENSIMGTLEMTIDVGLSTETNSMELELVIEGGFSLMNSTNEDELRQFLSVNGCASVYSIARGIVSSITCHICPNGNILLPMINVFRLEEN